MPVRLAWQNNSIGDSIAVYRSLSPIDPGALPAPLASISATTASFNDLTAIDGETYYYRLALVRGAEVAVSEQLSFYVSSMSQTLPFVTQGTIWTLSPSADQASVGAGASSDWHKLRVAAAKSAGKWFMEFEIVSAGAAGAIAIGIAPAGTTTTSGSGGTQNAGDGGRLQYFGSGQKRSSGTYQTYAAAFGTGDKIAVALDRSAQTVTMYKNGVSQGVMFSGLSSGIAYEPHLCYYGQPASIRIPAVSSVLPAGFKIWS